MLPKENQRRKLLIPNLDCTFLKGLVIAQPGGLGVLLIMSSRAGVTREMSCCRLRVLALIVTCVVDECAWHAQQAVQALPHSIACFKNLRLGSQVPNFTAGRDSPFRLTRLCYPHGCNEQDLQVPDVQQRSGLCSDDMQQRSLPGRAHVLLALSRHFNLRTCRDSRRPHRQKLIPLRPLPAPGR
jgi:hypothetical protein